MMSGEEYQMFLEKYRHIVLAYITENLQKYVVYPLDWAGTRRGAQWDYGNYNREDINRFIVDGKIIVPDGPYKDRSHHYFRMGLKDPSKAIERKGPSQHDNFVSMISWTVNAHFPKVIERYASVYCDFRNTSDCAADLTRKLKNYWALPDEETETVKTETKDE